MLCTGSRSVHAGCTALEKQVELNEFMEAIELADRMRERGVSISEDGKITIEN